MNVFRRPAADGRLIQARKSRQHRRSASGTGLSARSVPRRQQIRSFLRAHRPRRGRPPNRSYRSRASSRIIAARFADHDGRRVGVAAGDLRHDRGVRHAQGLDAIRCHQPTKPVAELAARGPKRMSGVISSTVLQPQYTMVLSSSLRSSEIALAAPASPPTDVP